MVAGISVNPKWKKSKVIREDVIIYYSYLPAVLLHGDVTMKYGQDNSFYADKMWGTDFPGGSFVQKYTWGLSFMYAPFFVLSHGLALALDYPADGYSVPYQFGLCLAAIFYVFLGLLVLRKLLRRYFTDRITGITLLAVFTATNLFYFTLSEGPMSHGFLFFLINLFAWLCLRFHETGKWRFAIWLSFVGGLAFLIRPPHILLWIIFILYGITSRGTAGEKLQFLWQMRARLLILPIGTVLLFFLQMCYWKTATGSWLYYSYGDERFFWAQPLIPQVLFSFRKGWFIYTPLMLLAVAGFFRMRRFTGAWMLGIVVYFALSLYVISCWWCWWYGGTFSQRSFIDMYGLLSLPLAALLTTLTRQRTGRVSVAALLLLLTLMNCAQTFQYIRGNVHWDSMNAGAWVRSWTSFSKPTNKTFGVPPDVEGAKKGNRNFW